MWLFFLVLGPLAVQARVTFDKSEVLDNIDLKATPVVQFRCSAGCRVYSPTKSDSIVIIDTYGNVITSLRQIESSGVSGIELKEGRYELYNMGPRNTSFVFYAVEKGAANYGSPVLYVSSSNERYIFDTVSGPVTIMSSTGAVHFSEFYGFSSDNCTQFTCLDQLPRVYASGYDSFDSCRPVFAPRAVSTLAKTAFTVNSPIATIYVKEGSYNQTIAVSGDLSPSSIAPQSSAVFVSPGYVGCPSACDSLYTLVPPVKNIAARYDEYTHETVSVEVSSDYLITNSVNEYFLSVDGYRMTTYGRDTLWNAYTSIRLNIRVDWVQEEKSRDGFALQIEVGTPGTLDTTMSPPLFTVSTPTLCVGPTTRPATTVRPPTTFPAVPTRPPTTGRPVMTSRPPQTTVPSNTTEESSYCNCEIDKFGFPIDWNFNDIWVDIVVILDTSEAMGKDALTDAGEMVESFISPDGIEDFLVTDTNTTFYSRVGVISMTETPKILYNLNMDKYDTLRGKATITKGLPEIDLVAAFEAAQKMLNDGLKGHPDRAKARQIIYYMTNSDTKKSLTAVDSFKASGVIIVNNFLKDGEVEVPALKELSSDGYYFSNGGSATAGLQAFCKANCFCQPDKKSYRGVDPAVVASGGCYHANPSGLPFNKAMSTCMDGDGMLATIHEEQKGVFLAQSLSSAKSDYFWFGYEKAGNGQWVWEDESTDSYTNWDVDEPSSASVAKCGYADKSKPIVPWGAGNCNAAFPYVCQYAPCSVGYKWC